MPRHQLTHEERQRGGVNGFRAAVHRIQVDHWCDFGTAVCWLKHRINGTSPSRRPKPYGS